VITSRQKPNMVQGSIRDNMCDTGTWLNETPSKRRSTIGDGADEQHDAHDMPSIR